MKVLVTGATGYIGGRLPSSLVNQGHEVIALVRDPKKLILSQEIQDKVTLLQGDLLQDFQLPKDIEAAYYLVHSMSNHLSDFDQKDRQAAIRFKEALKGTQCKQLIYLTGLISSASLSKHLSSRLEVEQILRSGPVPLTALRSGIIIGLGSASFKIIQDLVEKLPIMVAPKWVRSLCQPIGIQDVLFYLTQVLGKDECMGKTFDIGGPDVLSYQNMLLEYARLRGLHRFIFPVPFLSPKVSSYWLVFITSVNHSLAASLVDSLKVNAVCSEHSIDTIFPRHCLTYQESIKNALAKSGK